MLQITVLDLVWSRFLATRSDGTSVKLRIQDLPETRFEDALELFIQYFILEETFHKAVGRYFMIISVFCSSDHSDCSKYLNFCLGVARNPQAVAECRVLVTKLMKDPDTFHYIICCEDIDEEEVGQIVGASSVELITIGREPFKAIKFESDEMQNLFKLLAVTSNTHNIMEELQISKFYYGTGIVVHPEFRQLGIAREFLKARIPHRCLACVTNNVSATGALMTCIATQKAAEKDNWETVLEVALQELGRKHDVTFENGGVKKFMIWKNPQYKLRQKM
ncbi:uncharacterized protein LOC133521736 [Cydia pomonella]|uniref:uncharacterized protein LOC133521736 n=1 Tax=Cydia pomonella TaxID=82600 RepID=UPI002ADE004E|nr:uncharacterized protein LOC133521736 [Cydia pomonella]